MIENFHRHLSWSVVRGGGPLVVMGPFVVNNRKAVDEINVVEGWESQGGRSGAGGVGAADLYLFKCSRKSNGV